eukprot:s178_g19.t1
MFKESNVAKSLTHSIERPPFNPPAEFLKQTALQDQFDGSPRSEGGSYVQLNLNPRSELEKSLKKRQLRREVACAVNLRERSARYVYGRDSEGFEAQMRQEARELDASSEWISNCRVRTSRKGFLNLLRASSQFGPELLQALGEMYLARSETIYLANELHGRISLTKSRASMKHNSLVLKHRLRFYKNAAGSLIKAGKVYSAATKVSKELKEEQPESQSGKGQSGNVSNNGSAPTPFQLTNSKDREAPVTEEQAQQVEAAMDDALPLFLQTAWSYVVQDIDRTVRDVGRKFLQDKSVPWQIRIRRAQALQLLGEIFQTEAAGAKSAGQEPGNVWMHSRWHSKGCSPRGNAWSNELRP